MKENNYPFVDTVEKLQTRLAEVRAAQRKYAQYTQEQVDRIFLAAASAADKARLPLAKLAVEETGMGVVEDKVIKNNYASEYIYNAYKNAKTCGVIEEDDAFGVKKIAEPLGVIAAVIPTTNPTSTAIFKTLIALKTRNGIIISPHPRAKKSTIEAARIVLEAAVAAGAPEAIIAWIDQPSLDLTDLVMKEADIILATGGPGMVKAAYSSGKPALGVGPGNTPAIIDDTRGHRPRGQLHHPLQDLRQRHDLRLRTVRHRAGRRLRSGEGRVRRRAAAISSTRGDREGPQDHPHQRLSEREDRRAVRLPHRAARRRPCRRGPRFSSARWKAWSSPRNLRMKSSPPCSPCTARRIFEDAFAKAERLIADGGYGHTSSIYLDPVTAKDKLASSQSA
jgi:acetaldehyde dehydrogenase/alcohol dehydrogenase